MLTSSNNAAHTKGQAHRTFAHLAKTKCKAFNKWEGPSGREVPGGGTPCFYFAICGSVAMCEKGGRSVCAGCAPKVAGCVGPLQVQLKSERARYLDWKMEFSYAVRAIDGSAR